MDVEPKMEKEKKSKTPKPVVHLIEGTKSFRVLKDCPLVVMLLFQLYAQYAKHNVKALVPIMIQCLSLGTPPVAKTDRFKTEYANFLGCQVRTA